MDRVAWPLDRRSLHLQRAVVRHLVRDITGRKLAEAERERLIARMADDQARFEALVESMPAGVLAQAPTGRIVYGNRRVKEILRHPVLELPDVEAYGEWVGWHPDETSVAAEDGRSPAR